ncbi:hypothetical protein [Sphingomonas sp. Root710]|uniref:hypothetical protein n=1 Tax=Sphingomonas sp. Root710 TaxID=1736594 RepID=UPI0006FD8DCD|nr:hypothetical protein [Sphingomonas sp. Root710]
MRARGIWLDEATSLWLTRHDVSFADSFFGRWATDVHPPLFSLYAWTLEPLLGGSVRSMRLVNLGGLLFAAITAIQAWRRGGDRDFLFLFAVMVAGSPFFVLYAAEFRSYFLQLVLSACLIVQLRLVHEGRAAWPMLALTALLLTNLHYMGSLIGLILIGAEAIHLFRTGRGRAAMALLLIAAGAALPLALALWLMLRAIDPVAVNDISALRSLMAIGAVSMSAVLPYVAALGFLPRISAPEEERRSFLCVLTRALAAIMLGYALLNLATHNLLPRHMIAAVPIGASILALLLEDLVKANRIAFALICANAVLLAGAGTAYGLTHKRWETNVPLIERTRAACLGTQLYALNPMSLLGRNDPLHGVPDIGQFFATTYRLIMPDAVILPDGRVILPQGRCPALLWIEHHYARTDLDDAELARIAGFGGAIRIVRLQRGDARALLAIYPAQ